MTRQLVHETAAVGSTAASHYSIRQLPLFLEPRQEEALANDRQQGASSELGRRKEAENLKSEDTRRKTWTLHS